MVLGGREGGERASSAAWLFWDTFGKLSIDGLAPFMAGGVERLLHVPVVVVEFTFCGAVLLRNGGFVIAYNDVRVSS